MAKREKAGVVEVDFSNVKDGGGGGVRMTEGDYHMRVKSVKQDISEKSSNPMLVFQWEFVDKKDIKKAGSKTVRDNIVLIESSLFRLRNMLEAVGVKVPKSKAQIPIKKLVGKECGITLVDGEPYRGRIKSEVADFISLEELESGGVDDDDEDDLDDVDTDEDEDLENMDRDELKAYIKENELEVKVKKSMSDDDIREAIEEAEGDDDEDEDDDDDDDDIEDLNLDEL